MQLIEDGQILYASEHAPLELKTQQPSTPQTDGDWRYFARTVNDVTIRVGSSLQLIHADVGRIDRLVALAAGLSCLSLPYSAIG
ncbi:MAG: hypothetical protein R3C53_06055 [Pirellulaceae bacterium]